MILNTKISFKCGEYQPKIDIAYMLYGAITENLSGYVAQELHKDGYTPLSGYTTFKNGILTWNISSFGVFSEEIFDTVKKMKFFLKRDNIQLNPEFSEIIEIEEKDFIEKYLIKTPPHNTFTLQFITSTAFKSNGKYVIFPDCGLILKSIAGKWNSFAEELFFEDIGGISECVEITRYNLKSSIYKLKKIDIPGFFGNITLKITAPEELCRQINLLLNFAPYCGVGIKNTLGMGGVATSWRQ
jgi:CRISPR-associated endoribonuclease Cas6